ncbi:hypothetical protein ACFQZ8_18765, partial [Micromonospora azadirachtae]
WVVGCAALAVGALWAIPAAFGGAGLAQAMLYAMDLAHTLVVVAGLAVGTALVRLGAAVRELTRRRPTGPGDVDSGLHVGAMPI